MVKPTQVGVPTPHDEEEIYDLRTTRVNHQSFSGGARKPKVRTNFMKKQQSDDASIKEKVKQQNTYDFFSSGSYGCTMHPMMKCNGRKSSSKMGEEYVSKLTIDNIYAENEYEVGQIILKERSKGMTSTDDTVLDFFNIVEKKCKVAKTKMALNTKKHDCQVVQRKRYADEKSYVLFHLKYIPSIEVHAYIYRPSPEENVMTSYNNTSHNLNIRSLIRYHFFALKCIKKLLSLQLVHHDMHLSNVLVDEKNQFNLIDFGITIQMNKLMNPINGKIDTKYLYDMLIAYDPEWGHWSPEYHILCYLTFKNSPLTDKVIDDIVDKYYDNNLLFKAKSEYATYFPPLHSYKKTVKSFLKKEYIVVGENRHDLSKRIIKQSFHTWDLYQVSYVTLCVLRMHDVGQIQSIIDMCKMGLHYDCKKRMDVDFHINKLLFILKTYQNQADTVYDESNSKKPKASDFNHYSLQVTQSKQQ
jgi:serine/threonine protein kinase